jgi:hypothetical protein
LLATGFAAIALASRRGRLLLRSIG